ncbi:MAG TPA: AAA family ATPase [Amaricoccus sp.]|nr:AAA family ATPase [Amaricoccus sp.]
MKLRSISLTNVRRFAGGTVRLDGLGDGLNLVCAPNEAGKSTLFEALQALILVPARSGGAEARALRPYAGGAPEVAAEVELDGGRYRIAKRWLQRPFARVTELPSGRIIAQDDEAESWIAVWLAGDGPAELLWVRQGMLALEPEGRNPSEKAEQERLVRIRRDLLSSVAAELDAITGGRRLDAIASRCEAALAELATPTGRPKAGGRWRLAEDEAAGLRGALARLDAQCEDLATALAERAQVREDLARAEDPAATQARAAGLAEAERAAEAARIHRSRLDAARDAERAAALELAAAAQGIEAHDRTTRRRAAAEAEAATAAEACRATAGALAAAQARETGAAGAAATARTTQAAARAALEAAERAARANESATRAAALAARLDRARGLAREVAAATAEASAAAVPDADVRAAREAAAALDRARVRLEAGAVTLTVDYLPGIADRVTLDGRPLDPGATVACAGPATLDLPGLGRIALAPGGDAVTAARGAAAAEAALQAILAPAGASDLAGLVALAERRAAAEAGAARASAEIAGLAPLGTAHLEAEIAAAREAAAAADPDAPDPAEAAAAEAAARAGLEAADRALAGMREARLAAAHAEATARETRAAAGRTLAAAIAEAAALPDRSDLAARHDDRRRAAAEAGRIAAGLAAAMPDAPAAEARLAEARAAARDADDRRQRLATRDAELGARIATRADEGLEEHRDETAGRLDEAEARAAAYAADARALARLRSALADARAAARERYLAPVAAELAPLLDLVLDGAEVRLHPTRLLPDRLARQGVEEDLAHLSGGTREQIAILTRLAFARLLARSGRPTPVILDDALVFADDARFARVLAAIGAVAADVQVIVLTCRERAFATLPASRPALRLQDAEAAAAV